MTPTNSNTPASPTDPGSSSPGNGDDRYVELLMKAVDGLLRPDEVEEWERLVAERPEAAQELAELVEIKSVTDGMARRIRADAELEPPRETAGTKTYLLLGFVLMLVGGVVLAGWAAVEFMGDPTLSLVVKGAVATLMAGALLLLGYVVRLRLRGWRRDPYRHIDL